MKYAQAVKICPKKVKVKVMRRKISLMGLIATVLLVVGWLAYRCARQSLSLVWKMKTGMNLWHLRFMPNGRWLIGGDSQRVVLWDAMTGWEGKVLPIRNYRFALSPKGDLFAAEGSLEALEVWDLSSVRRLWSQWAGHWDSIDKIAFSPDGQYVATFGPERLMVKLWQASSGKLVRIFGLKGFWILRSCLMDNHWQLYKRQKVVAFCDYEFSKQKCVRVITLTKTHKANSIEFSPDGRILVTDELNGFGFGM